MSSSSQKHKTNIHMCFGALEIFYTRLSHVTATTRPQVQMVGGSGMCCTRGCWKSSILGMGQFKIWCNTPIVSDLWNSVCAPTIGVGLTTDNDILKTSFAMVMSHLMGAYFVLLPITLQLNFILHCQQHCKGMSTSTTKSKRTISYSIGKLSVFSPSIQFLVNCRVLW